MHTLLKTARPNSNELTHAPTAALTRPGGGSGGDRARVLDLGCGTGLWMLQMIEKFPNADYHGLDINYMLPKTIISNIVPEIPFDIESPWNLGWGTWEMIHAQLLLGSISNWNYLFQQVRRHLAPGGWFESVEIDWQPRCEDDAMNMDPHKPGLMHWWARVSRAYRVGHHVLDYNQNIDEDLETAGFKDIRHYKYKVPLCGWHMTDQKLHRVGGWWNIAMSEGSTDEGCCGLEAMSLRPLIETELWNRAQVQALCREALDEASNVNIRCFNWLHIVIARAPWANET